MHKTGQRDTVMANISLLYCVYQWIRNAGKQIKVKFLSCSFHGLPEPNGSVAYDLLLDNHAFHGGKMVGCLDRRELFIFFVY